MASEKEAADDDPDGAEADESLGELASDADDLADIPDADEQFCPDCSAIVAKDVGNCPECGAPIDELPRVEKNPALAAILSLVFAGLGQIYNGQFGKGVALLVLQFVDVLLLLVFFPVGIVAFPIVWIYAVNDAYRTAGRINAGDRPS